MHGHPWFLMNIILCCILSLLVLGLRRVCLDLNVLIEALDVPVGAEAEATYFQ